MMAVERTVTLLDTLADEGVELTPETAEWLSLMFDKIIEQQEIAIQRLDELHDVLQTMIAERRETLRRLTEE
jgi:hypothetical protein